MSPWLGSRRCTAKPGAVGLSGKLKAWCAGTVRAGALVAPLGLHLHVWSTAFLCLYQPVPRACCFAFWNLEVSAEPLCANSAWKEKLFSVPSLAQE